MLPDTTSPLKRLERRAGGAVAIDDGARASLVSVDAEGRILAREDVAPGAGPLEVTAGLVDLQVNGFAGVDFNDAGLTPARLDDALAAMLATGVTICLPTIITAKRQELLDRFAALDRAVAESRLGKWMVPGYHLEGPFLSPDDGFAGCHPKDAMVPASVALVQEIEGRLLKPILLVTAAPERAGVMELIAWAAGAGKLVAIGHSAADAATIARAVDAGARLSTHLGNGLPRMLPKLDNTIFAQLAEDRLYASFIADGLHIPRPALKAMIRAKGLERAILVTDAVSAAAAAPGLHPFAGMTVELDGDGRVREPGSAYLAGSSLRLDQALRNLVDWAILSPREALRLACANPLAALDNALRRHQVTLPASQVRWTDDLRVREACVGPLRLHMTA